MLFVDTFLEDHMKYEYQMLRTRLFKTERDECFEIVFWKIYIKQSALLVIILWKIKTSTFIDVILQSIVLAKWMNNDFLKKTKLLNFHIQFYV